jgi:hypothetical protein
MQKIKKQITNLLVLITIILMPGSGLLIFIWFYNKDLFYKIISGNINIITAIKELYNERSNRYVQIKSKR